MSIENITLPSLNAVLENLKIYASKAISLQAKNDREIINLSFGEPEFGPPEYSLGNITEALTIDAFLDSAKRYEDPKGSFALRKAIANWYKMRYGLEVDPETEIMITHGGVEAITLSILCTADAGDSVAITDPSYMLYERTITALGRRFSPIARSTGDYEYAFMLNDLKTTPFGLDQSKAIIINSPENPSGYVLDKREWEMIGGYSKKTGAWIIHDEVYDSMDYERPHIPSRAIHSLRDRSILINSFSKKFGTPGLRIDWMVANEGFINLASKVHDYLYLGVNIQYERIATHIISDHRNEKWLLDISKNIQKRAHRAMLELGEAQGFIWTRKPLGAMFLFPNVRKLYDTMPIFYKSDRLSVGDSVAQYLLKEKKVAVVPGSVYGTNSQEHIRLVLCTTDGEFDQALQRLK